MKKFNMLFLVALMVPILGASDTHKKTNSPCVGKHQKIAVSHGVTNHSFSPGEKLIYSIKYEFLVGGEATLEVLEGPLINCRPTFQFTSTAKSHSWLDGFFMVRDFNSSVSDKESLNSYAFHQNLREGGYRVIRTTTMDYVSGTYVFEKERKGKKTKRDGAMKEPVFDIFSAFYLTRTLPLELGGEYEIQIFSDEDSYKLKMKVHNKFEDVTTPAGKFECYRIEPQIQGDAIFKARDGGMIIWMTSDERRIPVLIRSKVSVGSFDAELRQFDTPKNDMVNEKVPT